MDTHSPDFPVTSPDIPVTPERIAELDRLGDEIAELSAHLEAATARLLDLIRDFDRRGGWNGGFRSCAHWLSWRVGLDLGAAREKVRVARALGTLPRLAQALARGELSYAKVRALTRVATPETEERLLGVGRAGTAGPELPHRHWSTCLCGPCQGLKASSSATLAGGVGRLLH
ncbi:MAG: 13E12 repeat family protein [Methanomicrobiales archaeon]|nr:13E12 repeat family protein [Methanomicrobiales archaeon]